MKTTKLLVTAIIGAVLALGISAAQATEEREPVELSSLPPVVQKAIKEKAAGGQIISIEKESDEGKWFYSVTVKTKGKEWNFMVDERGKIMANEEETETEEKK